MTKKFDPALMSPLARYLPFPKYVDLLLKGLYAPRCTSFEDPWEGHVFHGIRADPDNKQALAATIDRAKHWIYASCWHANNAESYAMWRIYGQQTEAVAVLGWMLRWTIAARNS